MTSVETSFRAYFERSPEPAYVCRRMPDGWRVLVRNRAAADGAAQESVGQPVERLFAGRPDVVGQLEACLGDGEVKRSEVFAAGAAGRARRFALTFVPVDSATAVVHARDASEEHRAREALHESERRAEALFRSNPSLLIRVTADGKYLEIHAPSEVRDYLPRAPEECVGRYVDELHEPDFAAQHAYYRRKVLEEGTVQFWQYTRRIPDGLINLEARFVPSGDEIAITVRDVGQYVEREREVVLSVERERNRIGQDLHDGLAQLLTGANLLLEPVREQLAGAPRGLDNNLEQAVDLIKQAIAQTRELARGLSPIPRGGNFSLSDALAELAQQSERYLGLSCRCDCRKPLPKLSTETSANLYRIAQEAITNAVKHGAARHVELACRVVDGRLQLRIKDDGCGIGIDDAWSQRRGMGLNIMRYRARAIGAELAIGPAEEGGTIVECTVARPRRDRRVRDADAGEG